MKQLKAENDKTLMQITKDLGIAYSTYYCYIHEKRTPDLDMLIKLADYFEVSLDWLAGRDAKPRKEEENQVLKALLYLQEKDDRVKVVHKNGEVEKVELVEDGTELLKTAIECALRTQKGGE